MKKIMTLLLSLLLILGTAGGAQASTVTDDAFTGRAWIGESSFPFYLTMGTDGLYGYNSGNGFEVSGVGFLDLQITTNIDPFIWYEITAINLSSLPVIFGFVLFPLFIIDSPLANVTATITGEITDESGNGVEISPSGQSNIQINQTNDYSWGVGGSFSAGPPAAGAGPAPYPYNAPPLSFSANDVPGPHNLFGETVAFSLSGFGDKAYLTGYCEIKSAAPIPEPTTLLFMGAGLMGLAAMKRKFNKN